MNIKGEGPIAEVTFADLYKVLNRKDHPISVRFFITWMRRLGLIEAIGFAPAKGRGRPRKLFRVPAKITIHLLEE